MAGQFGFKTETTYGTGVVVDKFMPVLSADPGNGVPEHIDRMGIGGSRRIQRPGKPGRIVLTPSFEAELSNKNGIATLLKHTYGTVNTAGAGPTYTHTFTPGPILGDSFTAQVGITDATDTTQPFTSRGNKINTATLTAAVGENAKLQLGCVAQSVTTGTALAAASFATDESFTFVEGALTIGGSAAPCRSFQLNINKNLRVDRFQLGSQLIREPLEDGFWDVTGQVEADFESLTLYNAAVARTELALVLTFTSGNGVDTLTLTHNVQLLGDPPRLDSFGLQPQTTRFKATHSTSDASAATAVLVNTEASAA